jgi:hypothetical protein
MEKVFIASNNTATFVCPNCENTTTVDVSKYAKIEKKVTVKVRCRCGHRFSVELEKRKKYRKKTDLPGSYTYVAPDGTRDKGIMIVQDISSTGMKLRLNVARQFKAGDRLRVEFTLDDKRRTPIEKKVIVQNVNQNYVGVAFSPNEPDDPALGFYLLA